MYQTATLLLVLFLSTQTLSQNSQLKENIANSSTQFALKLCKLLYNQPSKGEIVFFSPFNVYSTLALLHLGTISKTRSEIGELLGFSNDENRIQQSHQTLSQIINTIQNTTKLDGFRFKGEKINDINIANGVFVQKGLNLTSSFVSQVQSHYKGKVSNLDFINESTNATNAINQYISKATQGKITKLLSQPLTSDIRIILTSVLYFKAAWDEIFPQYATNDANFNTGSKNIKVKMMSNTNDVPYIYLPSLKAQALQLPYLRLEVSMFILLPDVDQSLDNLIQLINLDSLNEIVQKSKSTYVTYKIPKMKFKGSENIIKQLQNLGVRQVFTGNADLSNMISSNVPLSVSEITHAADIEVMERGTEASAVSLGKVTYLSHIEHPQPIDFIADRPFLFFIRHRSTNTILFVGFVENPNGK